MLPHLFPAVPSVANLHHLPRPHAHLFLSVVRLSVLYLFLLRRRRRQSHKWCKATS